MRNLILFFLLFIMALISVPLEAQKTFKAVCDKSDGIVKIVDGEDRSPNLVPLKGGFPFYQVAQNWVKENYPAGKCDPAAATQLNRAAADAVTQAATPVQNQAANNQVKQPADNNTFFNGPPSQTPVAAPAFKYRNTSMFFSLLFSNLGKVYSLDPPLIPGMCIGVDQFFGTKFYGGTGIHLNALIGKTDDAAGVSSFFSVRIPVFAGYRQVNGNRFWAIDMGLAANTMLRPVTAESHLAGEIPADFSVNTITRVRFGNERTAFEFGVDVWLNDLLVSEEGFQMTVLSVGYRYSF